MCGDGCAPRLGTNTVRGIFPVTASPCSPINISLLSKIDQSQTHGQPGWWQSPIMWPILSKKIILVTVEADNSEHLIRHDELHVCFSLFFPFLNLYAMYFLLGTIAREYVNAHKI